VDQFYTPQKEQHSEFGSSLGIQDDWGIHGGGHTVFLWPKMTFEHAKLVADMMNVARQVALLESKVEPTPAQQPAG